MLGAIDDSADTAKVAKINYHTIGNHLGNTAQLYVEHSHEVALNAAILPFQQVTTLPA